MILVTGATGFLGGRVCKKLSERGLNYEATSLSLGTDLRDPQATAALFAQIKPQQVIHCAAYVGGIQFGMQDPVGLFNDNLKITLNLLEAAHAAGVGRIVNPISNCAYPAQATLFREDEFWDGPLHESVMVYGFVRKASWVGAWAYAQQHGLDVLNLVLSNMYGPGDHFDEHRSHALGALIMKFVEAHETGAKSVSVWGTGSPVREWLHVDDGAEALIRGLAVAPCLEPLNIGVGKGASILELAQLIKDEVGYQGDIELDVSKPDGAPYKTVDGSRAKAHFSWSPQTDFIDGIRETIRWYTDSRKAQDAH